MNTTIHLKIGRNDQPCRQGVLGLLGLAPVLLLASCGYDRSLADRNTLGGSSVLPTLTGKAGDDIPAAEGPSAVSLLRLDWQPIDFIVSVDGTVHGPVWRVDAVASNANARQRSLHPTLESALQLGSSRGGQRVEGVVSPFVATGNVLAMPIMMIATPPFDSYVSPSRASLYKRARPGQSMAGAVPAEGPSDSSVSPGAGPSADSSNKVDQSGQGSSDEQ